MPSKREPEDILDRLYQVCIPQAPAGEYYVDLNEARGGSAFGKHFKQELGRSSTKSHNEFLCRLFSGHTGSGKSSELQQLITEIKAQPLKQRRYFPILLKIEDYMNFYDVDMVDILLALVSEVGATLLEDEKTKIQLADSFLKRIWNDIREFLGATVKLTELEGGWGAFKAKIAVLGRDDYNRKKVREKLSPQEGSLLSEINLVFAEARLQLKQKGWDDFVIVVDNLEKIQRFGGASEGSTSHYSLFIDSAQTLIQIEAHTIITLPLEQARTNAGIIQALYGHAPFILPMVKVRQRDDTTPYEKGVQCFKALLQKRLGDIPLEEAFTPEALDYLIKYSGGDVRDLMYFVREACIEDGTTTPIPLSIAKRALRQTVSNLAASISNAMFAQLAELERSPNQTIDPSKPLYQEALRQGYLLEYINGGDEDEFSEPAPWYGVNPIIRELTPFKRALAELRAQEK